jgi:hypothetical protein
MTKLGAPYWPLLLRGGTNSAPLNVERLRVHWQFEAAGFLAGRDRHGTMAKLGKSADT